MVNWNIIYAHSWPDDLYDDMVHYLRHGEYPRVLPQHIKRTFQKRVRSGYTLENGEIVLRVSRPPWIVNRQNKQAIVLGRAGDFVFRVVKASRREPLLRDLMSVMTKVSTNAHMFVDRVHREGYLGVSRRFIHAFLQTHSSTVAKRIVSATTNKEVVKSFRPEYPFQHWQIDTMDMIQFAKQNRGYRYIMVIIDIFTKFIYIHPLRNKSQFDVAQVLKKIFLSGDIPDKLHSDNGTEFKGSGGPQNYVGRLCLEYKVRQIFGDAYSPQTQGFVENKNKQIKTLLNYFRINNNSYNYVDILDEVAYTINNSKHAVTGYTPMELHKGRQVEKSYGVLAQDEPEDDLERIIDEPTDADLENYYHRSNALYDERVNHVKNTIKGVARKREQRQKKQPELRNGSYVYVMSYVTHGSDHGQIQGVFIRVGENMYEPNPLRLNSVAKQPRSMFSEFELKGPKKYYKFVFRITGIVKDPHAVTRYQLSTAPEMTHKKLHKETPHPVFRKIDSTGVYKREFNRNHLVLFDPTQTGMPHKTKQIRPNDLYIDLTFRKNQKEPEQQQPVPVPVPAEEPRRSPDAVQKLKTCSIESILKNKTLQENKPFIFLVISDPEYGSDPGPELAVFKVQLERYDPKEKKWVYKEEADRENPKNEIEYNTFYIDLLPDLYNKMGAENGWRFVEHNRWLLSRCKKKVDGHFATNTGDTPLVDYQRKLIDPSYDVQTMLRTGRQRPEIRYAFNSFDNGRPLGVPDVKTGRILRPKRGVVRRDRFEVEWENNTVTDVDLNPTKYGKLLDEIDGWEFADFNEVFSTKLNQDLKKI